MSKFKEVNINPNYPILEKNILNTWELNKTPQMVDEYMKDKKQYVYYDGPITANGDPHYGHALTWTMKDLFPRYYTMKGFHVKRNIGWDCQGILVEYEVEKKLGFKHKSEVEKMGIDKFNQACRNSVLSYQGKMIEYEKRLGRWIDHSQEYSTMNSNYIESIWWSLKKLYNDGLLYEGHKVVAYSTRSGMTLSSHEVADGGYAEITDPAVTVMFELIDEPNTYLLGWTTTPWTLPGNLMLSIGKKIKYVKVEYNDKLYILAKERVEEVFADKTYKIISKVNAESLIQKEYKPLFNYYEHKRSEGAFRIIYADHVNIDEGTGIVHLAPYGQEDFAIFIDLKIALFDYITETGEFSNEIPEYAGQFYKKANKNIIEDLAKLGLLFAHVDYPHQMPIDYRTKEPLIYKPITSWYVNIGNIKEKLLSEAKKVDIIPDVGKSRFVNWIENARDWSLSRRRYWGTPLPIWVNDKTKDIVIIGSFKELEEVSGCKLPVDFDPHKPFVDDISWKDKSGGTFRRVPEVIDVWYDSGSMPFARHHYPFENVSDFNASYPAEYISESDDQIRLWFYTMFVLGVALFDKSPFKHVIVTGMLGDADGKKMSKSKGNYPPIEEVFEKYGSDMLRYFLLTSPLTKMEPARFSYQILLETQKEFFTTLWNSYRYFVTYANLFDFEVSDDVSENVLDKWILIKFNELVKNVNQGMDKYDVMFASKLFSPFVDDLSTWYIRRSRDRISSGDKMALNTLYFVLVEFSKVIAPFVPFLAEEFYQNLVVSQDENVLPSVHMTSYPEHSKKLNDSEIKLLKEMEVARQISSLGNAIRKELEIPIRQPLSSMRVVGVEKLSDEICDLFLDELNIKKVDFVDLSELESHENWHGRTDENKLGIYLNTLISEDLRIEGIARELIREVQKLRKQADVKWDARVKVMYKQSVDFDKAVKIHGKEIMEKTLTASLKSSDEFKVISD